jgi:hypothetical protein
MKYRASVVSLLILVACVSFLTHPIIADAQPASGAKGGAVGGIGGAVGGIGGAVGGAVGAVGGAIGGVGSAVGGTGSSSNAGTASTSDGGTASGAASASSGTASSSSGAASSSSGAASASSQSGTSSGSAGAASTTGGTVSGKKTVPMNLGEKPIQIVLPDSSRHMKRVRRGERYVALPIASPVAVTIEDASMAPVSVVPYRRTKRAHLAGRAFGHGLASVRAAAFRPATEPMPEPGEMHDVRLSTGTQPLGEESRSTGLADIGLSAPKSALDPAAAKEPPTAGHASPEARAGQTQTDDGNRLVISERDGNFVHDCAGRDVTIEASNSKLFLSGICRSVTIPGSNDDVLVEISNSGKLTILGEHNAVILSGSAEGPEATVLSADESNTVIHLRCCLAKRTNTSMECSCKE